MLIIAEIGQAHEGSLGIAHSYIEALAESGVDAIKFQTHIAEAESSLDEPFRVKFSYEDQTRFDYWKRMEFSMDQWVEIKNHCNQVGLEFMSSPFSNTAVDLLEKVGVTRYKVGSGEVSNFLMLDKIGKTEKPIILSSGMSSFDELDKTISFLAPYKNELSILQCTTAYPSDEKDWGLNVISELKNRYKIPVGFSDHSGDIFACMAATSLGAQILEFHVVFDQRMFGPDAKASLTINQVKKLVEGVRKIESSIGNHVDKNRTEKFENLKNIFEKSLAVNQILASGEVITIEMLEAKKPKGHGIDANQYKKIINKKINRKLKKWDFINWTDFD
jgi:N,N'-diacetyllegionaminate synthase